MFVLSLTCVFRNCWAASERASCCVCTETSILLIRVLTYGVQTVPLCIQTVIPETFVKAELFYNGTICEF